jgi:hypothetical protein
MLKKTAATYLIVPTASFQAASEIAARKQRDNT